MPHPCRRAAGARAGVVPRGAFGCPTPRPGGRSPPAVAGRSPRAASPEVLIGDCSKDALRATASLRCALGIQIVEELLSHRAAERKVQRVPYVVAVVSSPRGRRGR